MKVLILANNDIGLFRFRRELIGELLKEHKVTVCLPDGDLVPELRKMGCDFIDTPMERRGMNPLRDLRLFRQYRQILRREKPDMVITYTIKPNVYGGLACRLSGTDYAANITGLGTAFQKDGLLKKIAVRLNKTGLKKAKTVFFENEENRQIYLSLKIVRESQTCRLNGAGVNLERFRVQPYPEGDPVRFLFVGRVMKEKGVDELLAAMRKLVSEGAAVHLDVLGDYEEDYQGQVEACQAEGWLTYHGFQPDVAPYIAAAHCFVLPSWHEGMANTNLECAASGRPVITSNIHGCLEAVEDGISGFLCQPKDADSLYCAMKKFLALSREERVQMGLAGRERMERDFDKKVVVEKTVRGIFRRPEA